MYNIYALAYPVHPVYPVHAVHPVCPNKEGIAKNNLEWRIAIQNSR